MSKEINEDIYIPIRDKLLKAIGSSSYVQSELYLTDEEIDKYDYYYQFSLIVYRDSECMITDVVPVWWEFKTTLDGKEVANDFIFSELKTYLINV